LRRAGTGQHGLDSLAATLVSISSRGPMENTE
jgi:hypothetical protein